MHIVNLGALLTFLHFGKMQGSPDYWNFPCNCDTFKINKAWPVSSSMPEGPTVLTCQLRVSNSLGDTWEASEPKSVHRNINVTHSMIEKLAGQCPIRFQTKGLSFFQTLPSSLINIRWFSDPHPSSNPSNTAPSPSCGHLEWYRRPHGWALVDVATSIFNWISVLSQWPRKVSSRSSLWDEKILKSWLQPTILSHDGDHVDKKTLNVSSWRFDTKGLVASSTWSASFYMYTNISIYIS